MSLLKIICLSSEQSYSHQILLSRGFVFTRIYAYLNEGDQFCECCSCLKIVIPAHLYVGFFAIFFITRALLKQFYLSLKLLQSRATFKQKSNHEVSSH